MFHGGLYLAQEHDISNENFIVGKPWNFWDLVSYLFCVGLDLLGGILRKLESTCLNGCCSFPASPFNVCEEEGSFDAEGARILLKRIRDARALQDEELIVNRRTRAKIAAVLYWSFIILDIGECMYAL